MAFGTRAEFEEIREVAFGSITTNYTLLGDPLIDYTRIILFNNGTDQHVNISFDGVTDHLRLANNSFKLFDLSTNKVRDDGWFLEKGTKIYIKYVSSIGTVGGFWVEVIFGAGGK